MTRLPEPPSSAGVPAAPLIPDGAPAPADGTTAAQVAQAGRSGSRRGLSGRRIAAAGVLVAAVAFGAVRAGTVAGTPATGAAAPETRWSAAAVEPPVPATPFTTTPPTAAPASFDPVVRFARFGWLPGGMVPRTTIVQAGPHGAYAMEAGLPKSSIGARVLVTFFPQGVPPHRDCSLAAGAMPRSVEPAAAAPAVAPAVRGRPATWTDGALRWEYAPGAWAEIVGQELTPTREDTAAELAALARIAGDLRFGTASLRFPLAVPPPAEGLRLAAAWVTEQSKVGWTGSLVFAAGDYCPDPKGLAQGVLSVGVTGIIPGYGWTGDHSNATVDGHRAIRQDLPGGGKALAVYGDPGPYVSLGASDGEIAALLGAGGLEGFYRHVQVLAQPDLHALAEPADQAGWTTDPVR
ncbi:hypothetical protein [Catellatospora bangladeshensis]|uniref:Uncharacterized protein n=1 Tax=Catellatospora bangladeshensis TaxID=310355 RepID=A0A8J3JDE9_9ACTN|nr:hypothetical protein [Catellatospora bangladeshensis]GIF80609.1 hypothetical protein Cba03nite_19580 [Catellatospora bangladeshensis]